MLPEADRAWLNHKRAEAWVVCPRCGKPVTWRRTVDGWTPCDEAPALVISGGRWRIVKRGELTEASFRLWRPGAKEKPGYGMIPHYYTCGPLREARREFAKRRHDEQGAEQNHKG